MKRAIVFLLFLCTGYAKAQNQISGIVITMPSTMPAATADWANVLPPVSITAQTKPDSNRSIPPEVIESKVLVTIKNGGSKVCGTYSAFNAPFSGFNSLVRNWRGGEVEQLLGQACTLQPGSYTLCVQFYNNGVAISEERCKPFTVKGEESGTTPGAGNISYTGPQAISPADGAVLNEKDAQQPITFRWTPVVPKPKRRPTYIVRVFEVPEGQTGASAIKTNSPIFEEEVTDVTMLIKKLNLNIGSSAKTNNSKYAWYVEAKDMEGKSYGVSGVNVFSVSSSNCSHTAEITSIECLGITKGVQQYKICVSYKNTASVGCSNCNILLNTPNNYPGISGGGMTIVSTDPNTVINSILPTVPPNLAGGQQTSICFNAGVAPGSNLKFQIHATCHDASSSFPEVDRNHENSIFDTITPACICTYCDQFKEWTFVNELVTARTSTPFSVNVSGTITSPNVNIKSFKAELISFVHNGKEECFDCNKDPQTFGNFTGGTFGAWGNGVFPLSASVTTHHTLNWFGTNGATIPLSGQPITISFTVPPFNPLSCCDDEIKFCIRYSFTDKECRTCSYVKCYSVIRKHHKTND